MANLLATLLLAASLTAAAAPLRAQVSAPPAYAGPRYPGGPDSLRALVGRSTHQTGVSPAGHALLQLELGSDGRPTKYTLTTLPGRANKPLTEAAATAQRYLQAHMLAWQPAPPDPEVRPNEKPNRVSLVLDFASPATAQPYEYADQNPVFNTLLQQLTERQLSYLASIVSDPVRQAQFQSSAQGLSFFCQMQVRYPADALRSGQQGTVYASFEVSENGAIQHPEIIGSAGRYLDDEVLRILATLPAATTPAQLRGQPVRVRYTLPITFKMM
jgi:protein TonB